MQFKILSSSISILCCLVSACVPATSAVDEDGARSGDLALWPGQFVGDVEPNDAFVAAVPAGMSGSVWITGEIEYPEDYDIYDVGAVARGAVVDARFESDGASGVTFCLFDDQQRLLGRSSPVTAGGPRSLELLVPESTSGLYLLAASAGEGGTPGYTATVTLRPETEPPSPALQYVVLNFLGSAHLDVGDRTYANLPAFDAASMDARFTGLTEQMIEAVLEGVRADFAGLGVQILLSSDPAIPPGPHSLVCFGGANPDLLGVAEAVDPYNAEHQDVAIVYTDTFALFSVLDLDAKSMAQVLANVTSHEIGHLLGLRHTQDPDGIMDVTATARRLSGDQRFRLSPLHASVCPAGYQDAPSLLTWTVGGQLNSPVTPPMKSQWVRRTDSTDFTISRSWLCSGCSAR